MRVEAVDLPGEAGDHPVLGQPRSETWHGEQRPDDFAEREQGHVGPHPLAEVEGDLPARPQHPQRFAGEGEGVTS